MKTTFTPDESQEKVIKAGKGYHIVLAPPGCGKTQILTERIRHAHEEMGIPYSNMLCLTFTNRAARGMAERIAQTFDDTDINDVFVGNIHRYCIKMLSTEGILPSNTAIIDDDDAISIMARFMGEDEIRVMSDYKRSHEYFDMIHLSQMMHQIKKGYPREVRLHTESLSPEDIQVLRGICATYNVEFNQKNMLRIYDHADDYISIIASGQLVFPPHILRVTSRNQIIITLKKMEMAGNYARYKREHSLVDFNDILLITYDTLHKAMESSDEEQKEMLGRMRKSWIQVDEVQDLSPMQMAIVDLLMDENEAERTVMYLGDEQQSIFSFMGARTSTLNELRKRCGDNVYHLGKNHRSPKYLLDVYNTYAEKVLGIDSALLPQPTNDEVADGALRIVYSGTIDEEYRNVANIARGWLAENPKETSAIIVLSNADADAISRELASMETSHFKISGTDLFATKEMKLILAHFAACQADTNQIAWARIIQGCQGLNTAYSARDFVHQLLRNGISPCELLTGDGMESYTMKFAKCYEEKEMVIFDTETTGLDTFHDDIIQIAAMKIKGKEVIGKFMVHIETDRTIPEMLGTIVNPIIEERKTAEILSHEDALHQFADFAGDAVLLAHNADFDIHILEHNIRRYAPDVYGGGDTIPMCFDSLRIIRLLEPDMRVYKLKYLLEQLHLEGANSHLADDDVFATKSLVDYCYAKAVEMMPLQQDLLQKNTTKEIRSKMMQNYAPLYLHTKEMMWKACEESSIIAEMRYAHDELVAGELIDRVKKLDYVCDYLRYDLIDEEKCKYLANQLMRYGAEINTLKEADLCNSERIKERIYVTTVHKAKGLEFDNVIVFDAVDSRYPNFNSKTKEQQMEDARKFYVAMSRAKKRLYISVSQQFVTRTHQVYDREMTTFMTPIQRMFR